MLASVTLLLGHSRVALGQDKLGFNFTGLPTISSYTSQDYPANGSNQAIAQDLRGVMYFGNQEGVLEFDGLEWRLIPNANGSFPKALAIETYEAENSKIRTPGRIYVGGIGEFGYLTVDSRGKLQYESLLEKIPPLYQDFEDIWAIHALADGVIFQSIKYVFVLSKENMQVFSAESTDPENQFHLSWNVGGDFYVRQWGRGLLKLADGKLQLVSGGERFARERIYSMLPYSGDTLIIGTRTQGMQLFDGKDYHPWYNAAADYVTRSQIYCGTAIGSDYLAYGTLQGGVVVLDKKGEVVQILTKDLGLVDNLVFSLYYDREGSLWVGQANGVSHVPLSSPFRMIDSRLGIEGQGFSAVLHDGSLWMGTVQGLLKVPWPPTPDLSKPNSWPVRKISLSSTFGLTIRNGNILAAQNSGIISIGNDGEIVPILKDRIVFSFLQPKGHPELMLAGTINGLVILENSGSGGWKFKADVAGFSKSIYYMAEANPGEIWISDDQKGIFKLGLNESYESVQSLTTYDLERGLPANSGNRVFPSHSRLLYSTENAIYNYDSINDRLEPDPRFKDVIEQGTFVHSLQEDSNGNIWLWAEAHESGSEINQMELMVLRRSAGNVYRLVRQPYRKVSEYFRSFYPKIIEVEKNQFLFSSTSGFVYYLMKESNPDVDILPLIMRKVEVMRDRGDSLVFGGAYTGTNGVSITTAELAQEATSVTDQRNIRYQWSALSYIDPDKTQYQYFLDGYSEAWSDWSLQNIKEYTNLPPGDYSFRVRAISVYGARSAEARFDLKVLTPWYQTWWAVGTYILMSLCAVWGIIVLNTRRLLAEKKRLESIIEHRTVEIRTQKAEIEREKETSDALLLNILPEETANELKLTGSTQARYYECVTVVFTDFKDFTIKAREMSPGDLVVELNRCFTAFDEIVSRYSIEKIKTIGDSYMCAAGLPKPDDFHALNAVKAALEIQNHMLHLKLDREKEGKPYFEIRIGIHSGPVVAGVVGNRKYSYDLWGDTVNLASRMESSGKEGEVNISAITFDLVKDNFRFEHRGRITAKDVEMDMYFVKGLKV